MKINAAFSMLPENPISIESATIPHSVTGIELLVIAKSGKPFFDDKEDTALIVDNPMRGNWDMLWKNEMFPDALHAYQTLKSSGRLIIDPKIEEFNLSNAIEIIKQRQTGSLDYNIDTLQNGHFAILATCLFFYNQGGYSSAIDGIERMSEFFATI